MQFTRVQFTIGITKISVNGNRVLLSVPVLMNNIELKAMKARLFRLMLDHTKPNLNFKEKSMNLFKIMSTITGLNLKEIDLFLHPNPDFCNLNLVIATSKILPYTLAQAASKKAISMRSFKPKLKGQADVA